MVLITINYLRIWSKNCIVILKSDKIKLKIDLSGYEYVLNYLFKLDNFYDELMKKYQPLFEHFNQ